MKRTAAIMMSVTLALSAALAVVSVVAATSAPSKTELAHLFGAQLDCATRRAVSAADESRIDSGDIMKAVDRCMSTVLLAEDASAPAQRLRKLAAIPIRDAELRREALGLAVRERIEMCSNLGVQPARFAADCPQIFTLEQIARE